MAREKKRRKKDSFTTRMKRRGREYKDLGSTLVHEPRKFPGALLKKIRRSIRTLWDARGGGYYACGYVITFVWLEIAMFVDDIVSAQSVGAYFEQQVFEIFFRYLGQSFLNAILAFIWPLFVLRMSPEWGAVFLGVSYLVFAKLLKGKLETWLFHDHDESLDPERETSIAQEEK